jgi:hypothetical protein
LNIFASIIDSYHASPNKGVPIGNLTSQYFANHYLAGADHFVKEVLQIRAFVRYQGVVENPKGPETGSGRVLRGGGWGGDARDCRSAYRSGTDPSGRSGYIGFRPVFVP